MTDNIKDVPFNRNLMFAVLVCHWATSTSSCGCGWVELYKSHSEHVVEVYEMSVMTK